MYRLRMSLVRTVYNDRPRLSSHIVLRSGLSVASTRRRNQGPNSRQNFRNRPVGGVQVVHANESLNLVEVKASFRVEVVSPHELGWERRAAALFSRK